MYKIILFLLFNLLLLGLTCAYAENTAGAEDKLYPNRKFYPQLNYITTAQMLPAVSTAKYNIIDARPGLAYKTLHIQGAVNISSSDKQFNEKLLKLVNSNHKPIVFYCGGLACLKSYKASVKATNELAKKAIKRTVYTYDSGISAFAYSNPDWVLKNGKKISPENPLLDTKKIKSHAKDAAAFFQLINNDEEQQYVILDIRESQQKILHKLFMFKKETRISLLEPEKLMGFLNTQKEAGNTIMIYGSVEKQIESLYPLVNTAGIKKWFYLEGGEIAYSKFMINQHVLK